MERLCRNEGDTRKILYPMDNEHSNKFRKRIAVELMFGKINLEPFFKKSDINIQSNHKTNSIHFPLCIKTQKKYRFSYIGLYLKWKKVLDF